MFTNKQHRLNYYVGGEVFNIAHLEKQKFLLGYLAKEGRVYLADKDMNIVSYKLETVNTIHIYIFFKKSFLIFNFFFYFDKLSIVL